MTDAIAFQKTCARLVRKFDGIWNKADGPSTSKSGQKPKKAPTTEFNKNAQTSKPSPQANSPEKPIRPENKVNTNRNKQ